jgi:hypothetical protein
VALHMMNLVIKRVHLDNMQKRHEKKCHIIPQYLKEIKKAL